MESLPVDKYKFCDFELDRARRVLTRNGEHIALSSKALALLLELVENHGTVVTKDALLERVWSGQFVEENNLTVQISALRKVLHSDRSRHWVSLCG